MALKIHTLTPVVAGLSLLPSAASAHSGQAEGALAHSVLHALEEPAAMLALGIAAAAVVAAAWAFSRRKV
jgi:hypothetical protein